MKTYKVLTNCLIAAISASLVFTGCGDKAAEKKIETKTSSSTNSNISELGKFPIVKEKITISIGIPAPTDPTVKMSENYFTKKLEEKTNIHINWVEIGGASFKEQINLAFASGDMPDMISTGAGMVNRFSKTEEAQFGSQGLIIPLNKLVENQGYYIKNVFKEQPELQKYITTPDGNIYALPNIDDGYHVTYPQKVWLNTTWLKNLNLSMPKTVDDFYNVMKAFKDNDPNKNGKKDEIPFSTVSKDGANAEIDGFLMEPFTYSPSGDRLWVNNGKVILSAAEANYKEGLKYLNKLYKEGLIYKESFTQNVKEQININESGNAPTIGTFAGMHLGHGLNLTASKRWQQYESVPPLTGPSGKAQAMYDPYTTRYTTGFVTITKNCKNPEAAFKLADYMYSEEATMAAMVGREGKEWTKAEQGQIGLDGRQAKYTTITVDTKNPEFQNIIWGQSWANNRGFDYQMSWAYPKDPYDPAVSPMIGRMRIFFNATKEHEKFGQKAENVLPALYYKQDAIGEIAQLKTTINDYVNESVVRFITGNKDIDKEWDSYISQLNSIGLKRYLQVIQENYDTQYKKK
jgi:putative aldouronate transport system substrate-binding protein